MPCFQRAVPRTFAGFSFFDSLGLFDAMCFPSFTFPLFFFFFFWCFHAPLRNGSGYVILSVEVGK